MNILRMRKVININETGAYPIPYLIIPFGKEMMEVGFKDLFKGPFVKFNNDDLGAVNFKR